MDKNKIIDYVMNTPHNANRQVLEGMLNAEGGGSSDFSTATVTIINGDGAYITGAFVGEDEYYQIEGELSLPYASQPSGANTIVLYKGQALLNCDSIVASISGDIEVASAEHNAYLVTGDCTITIGE